MSANISLTKIKLGQNADPAKNFLISTPQPEDGTLTIEREDGTDVVTVDTAGEVGFSIGILGFVVGGSHENAYIRTPSWLGNWLFCFGTIITTTNVYGTANIPFAAAYPGLNHWGIAVVGDDPSISVTVLEAESAKTTSSASITVRNSTTGAGAESTFRINFIRFGKGV